MIALLVCETTSYNFYSLIAFVFNSAYILCIDHSRDIVETIFFLLCVHFNNLIHIFNTAFQTSISDLILFGNVFHFIHVFISVKWFNDYDFFIAAFITEIVHSVVGKYIYNFQPLLTRTEVTEFNNSLVN